MADRTDRYTVQEVLDLLEVAARARDASPSIAPVDFDVDPDEVEREALLAVRRKSLSRYVIAAAAVACIILGVAFLKQSHGSLPTSASAPVTEARSPVLATRDVPATVTERPSNVRQPVETLTAGLIRFSTRSGWAWLDGRQLESTTAMVPCGAHVVQIGGQEQHEVVVPCGGEVTVER